MLTEHKLFLVLGIAHKSRAKVCLLATDHSKAVVLV